MKILFIVRSIGMGGATKQLAMTANAFINYGYNVSVYSYCWTTPYDGLSKQIKYIPSKNYKKLNEYCLAIRNIRKTIIQENPDIVISWRTNAGCFTRIATLGLKCKVIFSERTDPYMESSLFLKLASWVCNFSDGAVFQTDKARDYYHKLVSKSVVIPNPFDCNILPDIVPIDRRKKEIAVVGRFFMVQKRQDIMIDAFSIIHKALPDYKLVFYGDGIDKDKIKKIVIDKGLENHTIFKGAVKDVINQLKNSRLLVLTSDYEGIPNVILEAFAAGTPVVSTDCSPGGASFLIDNGECGFIVPIRDVKAISDKSIQLINDNKKSMIFINNGRNKLKNFKYEKIASLWNNYILSILKDKSPQNL